jgi:hypothetical protein
LNKKMTSSCLEHVAAFINLSLRSQIHSRKVLYFIISGTQNQAQRLKKCARFPDPFSGPKMTPCIEIRCRGNFGGPLFGHVCRESWPRFCRQRQGRKFTYIW